MGPTEALALTRDVAGAAAATAAVVGVVLAPRFAAFAGRWRVDATRWAALVALPVVATLAAAALAVALYVDAQVLDVIALAGLAVVCPVMLGLVVRQVRADDHGVREYGQHERVPVPR